MRTVYCSAVILFVLCAAAQAQDMLPLDISAGYNYDGYISDAEDAHAYSYDPPGDWGLGSRMVSAVFGEHSSGNYGRNYAWQSQVPQGGTGLPDSGEVTTSYGLFELSTDLDAEPQGGFVQIEKPTTPTGLLPLASNMIIAWRPHSGSTGWESATASVVLPTEQQDYYASINFLVSGSNTTVMVYADYDDGQGGTDQEEIYVSPGTPKTAGESGFPDILASSSANADIVEVTSYRMDYYYGQSSNYSDVRSGTARVWTFDEPLELDPSKKLKGFTLAIYDEDTWKARKAIVYAATAESAHRTWHVDAVDGDDETGSGSSSNPYQTIGAVWSQLEGGDTVVLYDGDYDTLEKYTSYNPNPSALFDDWVTFEAADGESPVLEHIWIGTGTTGAQDVSQGRQGTYDAYLKFVGIEIEDGVIFQNARYWTLEDCLISRYGPWTGSAANIEKTAVVIKAGDHITLQGCEITDTGTALAGYGRDINLIGNWLHGGSHDGVRVNGFWNSLVEGNLIHDFDDGVTDAEEPTWSRHCDLIHIFIPGPAYTGWQNHNVLFRNNTLYDVEAQGVQFNNYYGNPTLHNELIAFENNIFGPTHANMFNNADPTDGLIFRSNTVCKLSEARTYGRWSLSNTTLRIGPSEDIEVYNNILGSAGFDTGADVDLFDWNLIQTPGTPVGVDDSRAYGRFTLIGGAANLVDPDAFDGELASDSDAINAGTRLFAPDPIYEYDIEGTARDNRPDMGAWEYPNQSPAAETQPPVYQDTKTIFLDDFEDGHYADVDPWLQDENTQGMSWYRPEGYDDYKFCVTNHDTILDRNALNDPIGATGQQRVAWILSEQGADWADYSLEFDAHNSYLVIGSGPVVLAIDEDNCYWIDISRDNGRLIRILDGSSTTLATDSDIEMPHIGEQTYVITVEHVTSPDGIKIEVDVDGDQNVELSYTDTDSSAVSTFTAGGVGFHNDTDSVYHRIKYDNIRVEVSAFDE